MGSQRVRQDLATEQQQQKDKISRKIFKMMNGKDYLQISFEFLRKGRVAKRREESKGKNIEQAERILFETNLKLKNRYKVIQNRRNLNNAADRKEHQCRKAFLWCFLRRDEVESGAQK